MFNKCGIAWLVFLYLFEYVFGLVVGVVLFGDEEGGEGVVVILDFV